MDFLIWIPLILIGIIGLGILVCVIAAKYCFEISKKGIEAQAIILSVDIKMKEAQTPQYYYQVVYYGKDGERKQSTMHFQSELPIGSFVYIKYLPNKPKMVNFIRLAKEY